MDCLEDYIGLRGCTDSEPESGLYINDLPGISLETIDKIADQEQTTYINVWADIQRRALRRFSTLFNNWMSLRYQIKNVTQSGNIGRQLLNQTSNLTPANAYRGFSILLSEQDDYVMSNLHVIHIQSLLAYQKAPAAAKTIVIDDIVNISGDTVETIRLGTFTTTSASGYQTIAINTNYKPTLGLFIGTDANGVTSLDMEIPQSVYDYCGCVCECYGCEAKVQGAVGTYSGAIGSSLNSIVRTDGVVHGLGGIFSIGCAWDQAACDNRDKFATALWYLMGYEYAMERLYSLRLNRFVTIDREKVKEMRDDYWKIFNEELQVVLEGIDIKQDCCIMCNAQVKQVQAVL